MAWSPSISTSGSTIGTSPASCDSAAKRASSSALAATHPSLGMPSPMAMTARHLVNFAPSSTYSPSRPRRPSSPSDAGSPPRDAFRVMRPAQRAARTTAAHGAVMTTTAARFLAVVRVATGFVFLWAFLDKTFGFGYATPVARAWIHGGSPTKGFLSSVAVGPFESTFHTWAGAPGRTGCS
jgi:hypothetical protein